MDREGEREESSIYLSNARAHTRKTTIYTEAKHTSVKNHQELKLRIVRTEELTKMRSLELDERKRNETARKSRTETAAEQAKNLNLKTEHRNACLTARPDALFLQLRPEFIAAQPLRTP